jgi:hypothetical protein
MLRALTEAAGGLYVSAVAERKGKVAARRRFAADIARYAGIGPGRSATTPVGSRCSINRDRPGGTGGRLNRRVGDRRIALLDGAHTELPGLLQLLYDRSRAGIGPAGGRVVLCGSAISVMSTLLSGTKALRAGPPSTYGWRRSTSPPPPGTGVCATRRPPCTLHATLGGSPGYRDLASLPPPRNVAEFGMWAAGTVLNPGQALFSRSETEYLLREDPKFTGSVLHYAILNAVAAGRRARRRSVAWSGGTERYWPVAGRAGERRLPAL